MEENRPGWSIYKDSLPLVRKHKCILRLNTLRPGQNGRHFPDDHLKCIFLNENIWISINISLKFVPRGRINNIPTLVQIMAWCRPGDKKLSHYLNQWWLDYRRIYASLGLNELTTKHSINCKWLKWFTHVVLSLTHLTMTEQISSIAVSIIGSQR